jgi:tetratricopeptide (TPR) repeat protein
MADDVRRWSDELARDPASLVFLQLGEALRRQGQLEVALKIAMRGLERHPQNADAHDLVARIAVARRDLPRAAEEWQIVLRIAPGHVGAMKGLGFVAYQEGRMEDAERLLEAAKSHGGSNVANALAAVRRSSGGVRADSIDPATAEAGPQGSSDTTPDTVFSDLLRDATQQALLLDGNGYVMAGVYRDAEGANVSQDVGAQLSGISDEVLRAARHLDLGEWRSITFETPGALVAMAPAEGDTLVVVATSRSTPLGFLRRLLDRSRERAAAWLGGRAGAEGEA